MPAKRKKLYPSTWSALANPILVGSIWAPLVAACVLGPDLLKQTASAWFLESETDGQIIVDSPKVYTRERLVNDRLEEARWLEFQLEKTDDQLFKPQFRSVSGQINALNLKELRIASGVNSLNSSEQRSNINDKKSLLDQPEVATRNLSPEEPTIDRFRDLHTFREEVRAELMQTQLDDRHDLVGNTIYRLTFDTTILPGPNTRKLAWIEVELTKGTSSNEVKDIYDD